jgi:hypothetical protein
MAISSLSLLSTSLPIDTVVFSDACPVADTWISSPTFTGRCSRIS